MKLILLPQKCLNFNIKITQFAPSKFILNLFKIFTKIYIKKFYIQNEIHIDIPVIFIYIKEGINAF